jgi:hypothetical protein
MVTLCNATFNIKKFDVQRTQCVCFIWMDLRPNYTYLPVQHWQIAF